MLTFEKIKFTPLEGLRDEPKNIFYYELIGNNMLLQVSKKKINKSKQGID